MLTIVNQQLRYSYNLTKLSHLLEQDPVKLSAAVHEYCKQTLIDPVLALSEAIDDVLAGNKPAWSRPYFVVKGPGWGTNWSLDNIKVPAIWKFGCSLEELGKAFVNFSVALRKASDIMRSNLELFIKFKGKRKVKLAGSLRTKRLRKKRLKSLKDLIQ